MVYHIYSKQNREKYNQKSSLTLPSWNYRWYAAEEGEGALTRLVNVLNKDKCVILLRLGISCMRELSPFICYLPLNPDYLLHKWSKNLDKNGRGIKWSWSTAWNIGCSCGHRGESFRAWRPRKNSKWQSVAISGPFFCLYGHWKDQSKCEIRVCPLPACNEGN